MPSKKQQDTIATVAAVAVLAAIGWAIALGMIALTRLVL